jgi:CheY-like chemotaxis protein
MRDVVESVVGFEACAEVATGQEAIRCVELWKPDLVLMDVHLPDLDGIESAQRIQAATADQPRLAVVLLSTYEAVDYAPLALAAGALAYVPRVSSRQICCWRSGRPAHGRERSCPDRVPR